MAAMGMADTTADIVEGQKELIKKVTFIGNVLNKNIVPASAQKEKDTEDNAWKKKLFGFMSGFQDQFEGMTDAFKTRAKAAGGGLLSMLKKGALLMAIPAILALLQSDMWKTIKDWFVNSLLPALKSLWEGLKELWVILEPHVTKFLNWLKTEGLSLLLAGITASLIAVTALFDDISAALSGEGSWISVLMENKAAIAAISLLLFPKLTFFLVKTAAAGIGIALKALSAQVLLPMGQSLAHGLFSLVTGAATKLAAAITALNAKVLTPMITSLATQGLMAVRWAATSLQAAFIALNTSVIQPMISSIATKGLMFIRWAAAGLRAGLIALNTSVIVEMTKSMAVAGLKYIVYSSSST